MSFYQFLYVFIIILCFFFVGGIYVTEYIKMRRGRRKAVVGGTVSAAAREIDKPGKL